MSRQIQLRRGTAEQHEQFIGADGEVTVDTTNCTLRIHDGETPGGVALAKQSDIPTQQSLPDNYDFVIESQLPTAENNYTWYRKYKSGWVEQGGVFGGIQNEVITLPIEMADNRYQVMLSFTTTSLNMPVYASYAYKDKTTNSFVVINSGSISGMWGIKGLAK